MRALLGILRLWRPQAPWLAGGAALTVLAVLALAALAFTAGATPLVLGSAAVLVALRALGAGRVVLRYLERLATHAATFRALAGLRVWLFRALAGRSSGGLGFLARGDVLSRLVGDVDALDGLYLRILIPLLASLVLLPVLAVAGGHGTTETLAICGLFVAATVVIPAMAARATLNEGTRLAEAASGLRVAAVDVFGGMREVRAFGTEGRMLALVQAREAALFDAQRVVARNASLAQAAAALCAQGALLIVLLDTGSAAAILPAVLLTLAAFEAGSALPRAGVLAGYAAAAATRVLAVAGAPDPVAAEPAALPAGTALRFDAVRYAWPGRPTLFEGLALDIPAGSRAAILGPSGAGKSTIAALAMKVVAPQAGRVLLGGVDLAVLRAEDVRRRIAFLGQDTHVFADTVRANLLLGRPDADDAAVWQALAQAGLDEVVRGLPDRLDTWIGEGGAGLSGGQQRRVGLARALLSQAPILILDEPATGLDDAAERAFFATLNEAAAGRTVILIVHRLLGIERIDRIWRLSGGHAVAAAR